MGWRETGPVFTRFLSGATVWLLLILMPPAQGQDVAQASSAGETPLRAGVPREPVVLHSESLPPGITVEHRGRLLVLTYGSKSAGGVLSPDVNPRDEPSGFVVYQGQRPIASGQFEYG